MHLQKRGRVYYFRRRIPHDLRVNGHPDTINKSTMTTSRQQANASAKILSGNLERLFTAVRLGLMTKQTLHTIIRDDYHSLLESTLESFLDTSHRDPEAAIEYDSVIHSVHHDHLESVQCNRPATHDIQRLDETLQRLGEEPDGMQRKLLEHGFMQNSANASRYHVDLMSGDADPLAPLPSDAPDDTPPPPAEPKREAHSLAKAYERYQSEKLADKRGETDTRGKHEKALELFFELVDSSMDIREFTDEHAAKFREDLSRMPKNRAKHFPGVSARELIRREFPMEQRMTAKTINENYLRKVIAFFDFAVGRSAIPIQVNPFPSDIFIPETTSRVSTRDHSKRELSTSEMNTLIQAWACPEGYGPKTKAHALFKYMLVFNAFTGLRIGESINLRADALERLDDHHVLTVAGTKTENAARIIPVCQKLKDLHLIEFLQHRAEHSETGYAFPYFWAWETERKRSQKMSEYWNRQAQKVLGRSDIGTHSLRKSFSDENYVLDNIPAEEFKQMFGHAKGDVRQNHYQGERGKRGQALRLAKLADTFDYEGLETDSLDFRELLALEAFDRSKKPS